MSGVFLTEEEIKKVKALVDSVLGAQAQLDDASTRINQLEQELKDLQQQLENHGHYSLREFIE